MKMWGLFALGNHGIAALEGAEMDMPSSLEEAYLKLLYVLFSILTVVVGKLWAQSVECNKDRKDLRVIVEELREAKGEAAGELKGVKRCPVERCPFKEPA